MIAQQLYEGIELGEEGPVGLITYMRTDSTRIAAEAMDEVRQHISGHFGRDYLPDQPVLYKTRKGAQEAHEAIRPAAVSRTAIGQDPSHTGPVSAVPTDLMRFVKAR